MKACEANVSINLMSKQSIVISWPKNIRIFKLFSRAWQYSP